MRAAWVIAVVAVVAAALGVCGSDSGSGGATTPTTTTSGRHDSDRGGHDDAGDAHDAGIDHHDDGGRAAAGDLAGGRGGVHDAGSGGRDFVSKALGVPPVLGPFAPGDTRSGEIDVFSPGEGGNATMVLKSTLVLRQLGPSDGWFVLSAASDNATISSPAVMATVPRGH